MASINRYVMNGMCSAAMFVGCAGVVSATSVEGGHDFDFGIGTFNTHIKRLEHPLSGSATWTEWNGTVVTRKIWDDGGNLEELSANSSTGHFEGLTLRLYNARTHQWNLYWAGSNDGTVGKPMTGEFKQGKGVFYDKETIDGHAVLVRNIYSGGTATSYHFEQAYSADGGKTWETNFVANLTRAKPDAVRDAHVFTDVEPAAQHDFDWQFGDWRIHMARLRKPLTGSHTWSPLDGSVAVEKIWGGRANLAVIDTQGPSGHLQFLSLRLYDPKTGQWSLNFASRGSGELGVPMLGAFKHGVGEFYSHDRLNGKPIDCRFIFANDAAGPASEEQAFSADGGKTWEVNWINTSRLDKAEKGRPDQRS